MRVQDRVKGILEQARNNSTLSISPLGIERGGKNSLKGSFTAYYFNAAVEEGLDFILSVRIYKEDPTSARVDIVGNTKNANKFGVHVIKQVLEFIKKRFKKVTNIYGDRVTGARQKSNKRNIRAAIKLREVALAKPNLPAIGMDTKGRVNWKLAIQRWAKTQGFKNIGSGAFGTVFYNEKKPDIVVKVFQDKSYFRWVQLCQTRLKGNAFVPVFKGKPVRLYPGIDLWAIRIEKLKPYNGGERFIPLFKQYLSTVLHENFGVTLKSKGIVFASKKEYENFVVNMDEDLFDVVQQIGFYLTRYDNQYHYTLDIHNTNLMMRGSQIVITDPLAPNYGALRSDRSLPDTDVE